MKNIENVKMFEMIYENAIILFEKFYIKKINKSLKISFEDYVKLQCIFALKSLKKTNFEMIKEIKHNVTVDNIISTHLELEKKYWIFEKKELYPYYSEFRREIFKLYSILAVKNIIKEKITVDGIKTYKQWIIEYDDFELNEIEKFKISFSPFQVYEIKDRYFLISDFFYLTTEVFKENIHSSKRFKLRERTYLENLCNIPLFFDEEVFELIYNRKLPSLGDVEERIKDHISKMKRIREDLSTLTELNQQQYVFALKKKIKYDMLFLNEISLFVPFKIYLYQWLNKKFSSYDWTAENLSIVWENTTIANLVVSAKNNVDSAKMEEILENENIKILELILSEKKNEKKNERYRNEIKTEKIEEFINLNEKRLISLYKILDLTGEVKNSYSKEMIDIRALVSQQKEEQALLSELYALNNLKLINSIKEELRGEKIYFPLFYDFRGRMYVNSTIGVTNLKLSRYFFHYGWYTKTELEGLDKISIEEIRKFDSRINNILSIFNIKRNDRIIKESVFWCILAIAKEYIDKGKISNTLDEIFMRGYDVLLAKNEESDDEKWLTTEYYKKVITSFNDNEIKKSFIQKDATASFIQNTIRILGPKNSTSLEYANLKNNDKWYDTYALALEFWKQTLKREGACIEIDNKLIKEEGLKYFNRKTIKKPVMTDSYEATYLSQWDYFRIAVKKEFHLNIYLNTEVEVLFKNFIKFLNEIFWDEYFLAMKSDTMISYIENLIKDKKHAIISSFDSESDIIYYKFKTKTIDVVIRIPELNTSFRKTKSILVVDESDINFRKIKNAVKPNWVHFSDAYLVRQINSSLSSYLFTVHDCFLVDCLNVSNFIIKANKAFKTIDSFSIAENKDLIEKIDSIFIFF